MISLREIKLEDAPFMFEWMHDPDIQKGFMKKMNETEMSDVIAFCRSAAIPKIINNGASLHYAIADAVSDEYLGTISLKNINQQNKNAEYAISLRKKAHGKGIAFNATCLLLKLAFQELGLHKVYLNVLADNQTAIRLYERCGFVYEGEFREHVLKEQEYINWKWYGILETEFFRINRETNVTDTIV